MPNRKYKHSICVYCGARPATTKDHVIALKFFLVPRRGNLPKVPACAPCNTAKSKLEQYLQTVLSFGGRHADAADNLQQPLVQRRLAKNLALHRKLKAGMSREWTREAGVYRRSLTMRIEPEKLEQLCEFVAKGLAWHHWGVLITAHTHVWAGVLTAMGVRRFTSWMAPARVRVACDLGNGTFNYEGVQASDNPCMTIWVFSFYGGIKLSGDAESPMSKVGAVTGSARFMHELRKLIREPAATP